MALIAWFTALLAVFLARYGDCLTLVLVSMGDNPTTGIQITGPAVDVAIRHANAKYDGVFASMTRRIVYKPGTMSCALSTEGIGDEAGKMSRTLLDSGEAVILFSAGCSTESMVLGDFAREWNALLLLSQAGSATFTNREQYGTTVTFGPSDHGIIAEATAFFIDQFGWRTVTILCERGNPRGPERPNFIGVACTSIQKALINGSGKYVVHITYFDPFDLPSYRDALQKIARESRIILVYTDIVAVRILLVIASSLGMTNGEYAYVAPQTLLTRVDGEASWRRNDIDDPIAFDAMKSLIIVNNQSPNWTRIGNVVRDILEKSRKSYNHSCRAEEVNDLAISAYEAVLSLAQVIYDLPEKTLKDGRKLAMQFTDRAFALDSREVFIGKTGVRNADVNFWRLDNDTRVFERAWTYAFSHRFHLSEFRLSAAWPNRSGPPGYAPVCGFRHELCDAQSRNLVVGMALGIILVLGFCGIAAFVVRRTFSKNFERNRAVWLLNVDSTELTQLTETQIRTSSVYDPLLTKLQENLRVYDGRLLWTEKASKSIPAGQILSNKKARALAATIKSMSHQNLVEFFGVCSNADTTRLLWKYGSRGTLRSFLDSGRVSPELRIPMCWDAITGLQYLNRTSLRFHGRLSSLNCMIDQQFSLQLGGIITARFFACFSTTEQGFLSETHQFWVSPEILRGDPARGTSEADIFALGIIMCEIITGRYPMDISLDDPRGLAEKAVLLEKTGERISPGLQIPKAVGAHLTSMMNHVPEMRPTLQQTVTVFARSFRRVNAVSSLISRMESFAMELEDQVGARTIELREQQIKVDNLLGEIVPAQLIWRLRNKQTVEPESFDSFTLMFSALPYFAEISSVSAPRQIVSLLHSMYILLDRTLSNYDAYKVETIKDSYMVASGLPVRNGEQHANNIARLALRIRKAVHVIECPVRSDGLVVRIGIHSGACVAGVIGTVMPRYCLFGDTVNTCSRLESSGLPDKVHISFTTKNILERTSLYKFRSRGAILIKGKGNMDTFWLEDDDVESRAQGPIQQP